jgi:hypothetical protein
VYLRNFAGHGATYLPEKLRFGPDATRLLLRHLAHALDTMWKEEGLPANLAAVQIHPMWVFKDGKQQPAYVRDIQTHLTTKRPSEELAHESSWRDTKAFEIVSVDTSSPAVTGRGE